MNKLKPSVRSYIHDDNIYKRYLRPEEASKIFGLDESRIIQFASAAGAIYQLPSRVTSDCNINRPRGWNNSDSC